MTKIIERLSPADCRKPIKTWLCDGDGLWLRTGADGDPRRAKTTQGWIYRFVSPLTGRKRKYGIGPHPEVSLKDARLKRDELAKLVRAGRDPTDERKIARGATKARQALYRAATAPAKIIGTQTTAPADHTAPATDGTAPAKAIRTQTTAPADHTAPAETFATLAERFLQAHAGSWRGENTLKSFNRRVARVIEAIGDKAPLDIDTTDVLAIVEPLWLEKRNEAEQTRGVLQRVIGYGLASLHQPQTSNPAIWKGHMEHLLPRGGKTTNHIIPVRWEQAPALWRTLLRTGATSPLPSATLKPFMVAACPPLAWMFALGCRGAEARRLRAGWLDREQRIVKYPATIVDTGGDVVQIMKGGKGWWQPLNDAAMQVLDLVGAWDRAPDQHVFQPVSVSGTGQGRSKTTAANGDGEMDDSYLSDCLRQLTNGEYSQAHGIRSALRMWLADTRPDCPEYLAEAAIAHTFGTKVQRAYQQSRLVEAKRPFMDAWGEYLTQHVEGMI